MVLRLGSYSEGIRNQHVTEATQRITQGDRLREQAKNDGANGQTRTVTAFATTTSR